MEISALTSYLRATAALPDTTPGTTRAVTAEAEPYRQDPNPYCLDITTTRLAFSVVLMSETSSVPR